MTEQKQTPQYSIEELKRKKRNWGRFSLGAGVSLILVGIGSFIYAPNKTEEVSIYENAQQAYNWLQEQKSEIEPITTLPYVNEDVEKFVNLNSQADSTKVKALEDAIESTSSEMTANLERYKQYNSYSKKLGLICQLGTGTTLIGLAYGSIMYDKNKYLLKESEASKKC